MSAHSELVSAFDEEVTALIRRALDVQDRYGSALEERNVLLRDRAALLARRAQVHLDDVTQRDEGMIQLLRDRPA